MKHLRKELEETLHSAVALCEQVVPEAPVVTRRSKIAEATGAYQPTLMFYGHYNAGKSTLLNALLGEKGREVAETSDRPCTSHVHSYELGDYVVYDTPGIDAPIEHERISRAQLEKTHVVVFVTSTSGSFDERKSIEELAELYESGRQVVVVLNDKTGEDRKSPQVAGMRAQLLSHLEEETGSSKVRDEIDFVLVNAKTGVRARKMLGSDDADTRKRGQLLYEASGVDELGEVMLQALLDVQGEEVFRPAFLMLRDALEDSCDHLREQLGANGKTAYLDALHASWA